MHFPPARPLSVGTDLPWDGPGPAPAVYLYPARTPAHTGPPVLLIHGFRGDHHGLALIAHELRDHDVFVPDLPGFGRTPPPADGLDLGFYTAHISALAHVIARTQGMPPLLAGHSFGSVLAAHTFALTPAVSPGLGLISPIVRPPLDGSAWLLTGLTRLYYSAGARLPERLGDALLSHPVIVRAMSGVMATTRDRHRRAYIHDQHAKHFSDYADRRSLAQAYTVSIAHTVAGTSPALKAARKPVLLVTGGADAIAPLSVARGFAEDLRDGGLGVQFAVMEGVGHLVHYERPVETAEAIARFARTLER